MDSRMIFSFFGSIYFVGFSDMAGSHVTSMDIHSVTQSDGLAGLKNKGLEPGPGDIAKSRIAVPDAPSERETRMVRRDKNRDTGFFDRHIHPTEFFIVGILVLKALIGCHCHAFEHWCATNAQSSVTLLLILRALQRQWPSNSLKRNIQVDRPSQLICCLVNLQREDFFGHNLLTIQLPGVFYAEFCHIILDFALQPADKMLTQISGMPCLGVLPSGFDDRPGPEYAVVVEMILREILCENFPILRIERMDVA